MSVSEGSTPREPIEVALERAFAPMHKRVLGVAVGLTAAIVIFLITAYHVVVRPPDGLNISLLSIYFYGYEVSWRGALIGAWWAFVAGFVGGWFAAFLRNFVIALWLMVVRIRASFTEARDFLDHI
jgi:hypothetical protein